MRDSTLIVSATYDDLNPDWYAALPEPKVRWSTAEGGHPSQALIRAYREDHRRHRAYLLLQDSLEPMVQDVVTPFEEAAKSFNNGRGTPVVGWANFDLTSPRSWDSAEQKAHVERQYPYIPTPAFGIFGPIFWVERKVLERLDKIGRFPATPQDKMDAQGTERAWAYAFALIGITPTFLHPWSNEFLKSGDALPFKKHFAGRK